MRFDHQISHDDWFDPDQDMLRKSQRISHWSDCWVTRRPLARTLYVINCYRKDSGVKDLASNVCEGYGFVNSGVNPEFWQF